MNFIDLLVTFITLFSRQQTDIFVLFFLENRIRYFMQNWTIYMKCQDLISEQYKKK